MVVCCWVLWVVVDRINVVRGLCGCVLLGVEFGVVGVLVALRRRVRQMCVGGMVIGS